MRIIFSKDKSCAYKNHQGKASQEVCEAWLRIGHYVSLAKETRIGYEA